MKTLGIYIQVPFCASKCSFCNFSSQVSKSAVFDPYCHALGVELERLLEHYAAAGISSGIVEFPIDTIYMGGGTPSLLGPNRIADLLGLLREYFGFEIQLEFTIEVTPGSVDREFLRSVRSLGINRLSVGAQTFEDRELCAVGRLHSGDDTRDLVREASRAGFENISLDLIAGLPYQTEGSWLRNLEIAAQLRPQHLSVYLFEIDERSRLGREVIHGGDRYYASGVPSEEFMASAYERGCEFLVQEGYTHYELSNFALPGQESRHNQKYWQLDPYVGLGAGAHSFDGLHRWANETSPTDYQEKLNSSVSPIAEVRSLSPEEQLEEFFFIGLRQTRGVDISIARARWGPKSLAPWQERLKTLADQGWLEIVGGQVRLAEHAYLLSNEIFQEFVTV